LTRSTESSTLKESKKELQRVAQKYLLLFFFLKKDKNLRRKFDITVSRQKN
jgi:hypothetical protein